MSLLVLLLVCALMLLSVSLPCSADEQHQTPQQSDAASQQAAASALNRDKLTAAAEQDQHDRMAAAAAAEAQAASDRKVAAAAEQQRRIASCARINAACAHGRADASCSLCVCDGEWSGTNCDTCNLRCTAPMFRDDMCTSCMCPSGYAVDGDSCVDVDECATNNGGCDKHVKCVNVVGGYKVSCSINFARAVAAAATGQSDQRAARLDSTRLVNRAS